MISRSERRKAISTLWIVSTVALWILVLVETVLLLRLLHLLGDLREQGVLSPATHQPVPSIGGLEVGEQAPSFAATDYAGGIVELEDFQGQQCILAFISPDCSACAGATEALRTLTRDERNLKVLLIGDINGEANRLYAAEHNIQIPILTPPPDLAKKVYQIQGVPFVFVIDTAGIIRAKGIVNQREQLQSLLRDAFTPLPVSR